MLTIRYTVIHYKPDRPWLVTGHSTGHTIDVEHLVDFWSVVHETWPASLHKVIPDPGQGVAP